MGTIKEYIKYYKDISLKEEPWNNMDNLICAIFAYAPIKSFRRSISLNDFCSILIKKKKKSNNIMATEACEIAPLIRDSKRYEGMKFKNFVNEINEDTQFGAVTIVIKNIKVISFKGTDGSIIGWMENFRQQYMYPTYTQKLAIKYLNDNISFLDTSIYVTGHSKGGNLAMVSAMEAQLSKFKKIKKVVNFDGPGFRKKEFRSIKFKRLNEKLINIIPNYSYVGSLMYNGGYKVVTSKSHTMNLHMPQTWNTYGNIFVDGKLSGLSKKIHDVTSNSFNELNKEEVESVIETAISEILEKKKYDDRFITSDLKSMMNSIKSIDNDTAKKMYKLLGSLMKLNGKNNKK